MGYTNYSTLLSLRFYTCNPTAVFFYRHCKRTFILVLEMSSSLDMWDALRKGDKSALESLYREHAQLLLRYGVKVCGDQTIVEDCIQELFIILWQKRENLGDTTSVKNYLLASLRRAIYKVHDKKVISIDPTERRKETEYEESFEQILVNQEWTDERKTKIQEALKTISDRQREVIYLRFFENKDYEEICEIMDINYQSARNMLFKGLKSLRKSLSIWIIFLLIEVTKHC